MIPRILRLLATFLIFGSLLECCQCSERLFDKTEKGAALTMKTWYLGRFAVEVPLEMKLAARDSKLRYSRVEDFAWPAGLAKEQAREALWEKRMSEISKLDPPDNIKDVFISMAHFPGLGEWAKGVYYFGNQIDDEVAKLDLLVDFGSTGLWIQADSAIWTPENKIKIDRNASNIAKSYRCGDVRGTRSPRWKLPTAAWRRSSKCGMPSLIPSGQCIP